ncbi:MAG: hypothetical protein EA403_09955 [Spirochaetaceae bacterium]|nr:MAG: hypothetical protein EA403_09955 [Spirochaetaceae bacterium]
MNTVRRVAITVIVTALGMLTSCVELDTQITFRTAERGTIALAYRIDSRVLEIGMFDRDASIIPLPVGRSDFAQTAAAIDGLELRSYRMRERDGITTVTAELSFATAHALEAFFGPAAPAVVEAGSAETRFRHRLFDGFPDAIGEPGTRFADSFFSDASVSVTVTTPSAVTNHGVGERAASGRSVTARYTAADLLARAEPIWVDVTW